MAEDVIAEQQAPSDQQLPCSSSQLLYTSQSDQCGIHSAMSSLHTLRIQDVTGRQHSVSSHATESSGLSAVNNELNAVQETAISHGRQTAVSAQTAQIATSLCDSKPRSSSLDSSDRSPHLPDYSSIEIPQMDYPASLREQQYDAVVISTEKDQHIATAFQYILTKFITLEDGRHPEVCSLQSGFVHIQSKFSHMEEALEHSTYMFMIATKQFCQDSWAGLQRDECLMESITNPDKRWCVVPVVTQCRREKKLKLPFGLRALKAVNVSDIINGRSLVDCAASDPHWRPVIDDVDSVFLRNMRLMLNERLNLKMQREHEQMRKLQKWISEEQVRRYEKGQREKMVDEEHRRRLEQQLNNISHLSQDDLSVSDEPLPSPQHHHHQQQQADTIHLHVHIPDCCRRINVFNGPVNNPQFCDYNIMNSQPDSPSLSDYEVVEKVIDPPSTTQPASPAHSCTSESSHDSVIATDAAMEPASLKSDVTTISSCQYLVGKSSVATQSGHQASHTAVPLSSQQDSQARPNVYSSPSMNVDSELDLRSSAPLSTSPGHDGLPPDMAPLSVECASLGGSQRPAVAVIRPFNPQQATEDTDTTYIKTPLHHNVDDDDETHPKLVSATGNSQHHDDDEADRELKRVDEGGASVAALSDVSQLSITSTDLQTTSTMTTDTRPARHLNCTAAVPTSVVIPLQAAGNTASGHGLLANSSSALGLLSTSLMAAGSDTGESLSSIMMPSLPASESTTSDRPVRQTTSTVTTDTRPARHLNCTSAVSSSSVLTSSQAAGTTPSGHALLANSSSALGLLSTSLMTAGSDVDESLSSIMMPSLPASESTTSDRPARQTDDTKCLIM